MTAWFKKQGLWLVHTTGADAVGFVNYGAGTITESQMMILPIGYGGQK